MFHFVKGFFETLEIGGQADLLHCVHHVLKCNAYPVARNVPLGSIAFLCLDTCLAVHSYVIEG